MNIPEQYHDILMEEFKKIKQMYNEAKSPEDKLYIFSATFGAVNRVMNIYYDPFLVVIHQVLQNLHSLMLQRLTGAQKMPGAGLPTSFPIIFIEALTQYFEQFIQGFENGNDETIRKVLEKFTILSYATTGNGFYLFISRKLQLP